MTTISFMSIAVWDINRQKSMRWSIKKVYVN